MNEGYNNQNTVSVDVVREANQQAQYNNYQNRQEMNQIIEKNFKKLVKANNTDITKSGSFIGGIIMIGLGLLSLLFGEMGFILLMCFGIIGLIFIFVALGEVNKRKKLPFVDFNMVYSELYANDCIYIPEAKAFFTTNYLVSYGVERFVMPYYAIKIMYAEVHQQSGNNGTAGGALGAVISNAIMAVKGNMDVMVGLENGTIYHFFVGNKDNEVMNLLYQKNNTILYGNSNENLQAYKNIRTMYKQNMKAMGQQPVQQQYQQPQQPMQNNYQQYQQPMNNQVPNNYNNPNNNQF